MKLLKKTWFVFFIALLIIPIASYAATTTVTNEIELQAALNDRNTDTFIVANNIQVSNTITLPDDSRTINIQSDPSNNVIISANGTNYIVFYTLAFAANTSDPVENLPPSINYTVGEIITLPQQTPIRTGYTFTGWNTTSDGSGTQYGPGDMLVGLEQDSILYAQWTQNQNDLNFDQNTTDPVDNLPEDISYTPGDIVTIPNQIPTRDGFNFIEWNTRPDGTGTSYQPGDSFTAPEGNLTLYAQWEEDNNPILIWIIIGILLLLILIGTILLSLCYVDCNCETCINKNKRLS